MEKRENKRRTVVGTVVSDKMNKTRVVQVVSRRPHPKYLKQVMSRIKYKAHDEENASKMGDEVLIMETRRLSKDKRWTIMQILSKASGS